MRIVIAGTSALRPSSEYTVVWLASLRTDQGHVGYTDSPEILNDLVLFRVPSIVGMFLPVLYIDICNTPDEQFQLSLIEDIDKIRRDQLIKACNKSIELLFHPLLDSPFCDEAEKISMGMSNPLGLKWTYSMYSFLVSLVTSIFRPLGFRSIVTVSPNLSSSVEKFNSITFVISFSLSYYQ